MKNAKKLLVLCLAVIMAATLLTGCGKPDGRYYLNGSNGTMYLEFNGKNITVSALGIYLSGTYKIKGNQIVIKTNLMGYNSETNYGFSRSGNTITFEGRTFSKQNEGGSVFAVILIALLLSAGGGAAYYYLKRHENGEAFTQEEREELVNKVTNASKNIAKTASAAGAKTAKFVSAGVTVGIAASKTGIGMANEAVKKYQANKQMRDKERMEAQLLDRWEAAAPDEEEWIEAPGDNGRNTMGEDDSDMWEEADDAGGEWEVVGDGPDDDEWEMAAPPEKQLSRANPTTFRANTETNQPSSKAKYPQDKEQLSPQDAALRIKIDSEHCCICGKKLDIGATRLNGLQSGREAWLDSQCLRKLQIIAQSGDIKAFEEAARYMKSRISVVDPDVGSSLMTFIRKSEDRLYGDILK